MIKERLDDRLDDQPVLMGLPGAIDQGFKTGTSDGACYFWAETMKDKFGQELSDVPGVYIEIADWEYRGFFYPFWTGHGGIRIQIFDESSHLIGVLYYDNGFHNFPYNEFSEDDVDPEHFFGEAPYFDGTRPTGGGVPPKTKPFENPYPSPSGVDPDNPYIEPFTTST